MNDQIDWSEDLMFEDGMELVHLVSSVLIGMKFSIGFRQSLPLYLEALAKGSFCQAGRTRSHPRVIKSGWR